MVMMSDDWWWMMNDGWRIMESKWSWLVMNENDGGDAWCIGWWMKNEGDDEIMNGGESRWWLVMVHNEVWRWWRMVNGDEWGMVSGGRLMMTDQWWVLNDEWWMVNDKGLRMNDERWILIK